jgi:hypothetical protein
LMAIHSRKSKIRGVSVSVIGGFINNFCLYGTIRVTFCVL